MAAQMWVDTLTQAMQARDAVNRQYQQVSHWVDVRKHGAKLEGAGGADDTDALIASVAEAGTTGGVFIPPSPTSNGGLHTTSIEADWRRIAFDGVGAGGIASGDFRKTSRWVLKNGAPGPLLTFESGSSTEVSQMIAMRNIQMDGNKDGQTGTNKHVIYLPRYDDGEDNRLMLDRVFIQKAKGSGMRSEFGRRAIRCLNTDIDNNELCGWDCDSSDTVFFGGAVSRNGQEGIKLGDITARIMGADIFANLVGIRTMPGESNLVSILMNGIDRNLRAGILLQGRSTTVMGNFFHQNCQGTPTAQQIYSTVMVERTLVPATGEYVGGTDNCIIGNNFRYGAESQLSLPAFDIYLGPRTNNIVFGNTTTEGANIQGHLGKSTEAGNEAIVRMAAGALFTLTGSRADGTALQNLIVGLASIGLLTNSTTA